MADEQGQIQSTLADRLKFFRYISPTLKREEFSPTVPENEAIIQAEQILKETGSFSEKVLGMQKAVLDKLLCDEKTKTTWEYNADGTPNTTVTIVTKSINKPGYSLTIESHSSMNKGTQDIMHSLKIGYHEDENEELPNDRSSVGYAIEINPQGDLRIDGSVLLKGRETGYVHFDSKKPVRNNVDQENALGILGQIANDYLASSPVPSK